MNTQRPTRRHLPLATRHSDMRALKNCPSSWLLSLTHDERPATYNLLGTRVHQVVAESVTENLPSGQAVARVRSYLESDMAAVSDPLVSSKRPLHLLPDHGERCIKNWFALIGQFGDDLPLVEQTFIKPGMRGTKFPIWGTVDAIYPNALVDWKTSPREQRSFNQLQFYRFLTDSPGKPAYYVNLWNKAIQIAPDYPGDDEIKRWVRGTELAKEQLLNGAPRANPSKLCKWCPVAEHCPLENKSNQRTMNRDRKHLIAWEGVTV